MTRVHVMLAHAWITFGAKKEEEEEELEQVTRNNNNYGSTMTCIEKTTSLFSAVESPTKPCY